MPTSSDEAFIPLAGGEGAGGLCGGLLSWSSKLDADSVLAYTTVRRVVIRDRRLGILFLVGVAVTLGWVLGMNIYGQQLYRKQGDILGSVRLQLNAIDPLVSQPPQNTTFCGAAGTPGNVYPGPSGIPFSRYPCSYLDPYDSVWPSTEVSALFVSTRVTRQNTSLPPGCQVGQPQPGCAYAPSGNATTVFVGDVEMSTLQIEHLFTVPQIGVSRAGIQMQGRLEGVDGSEIDPCDDFAALGVPCPSGVGVGVEGRVDVVPIRTLLRAAGIVSLDARAGDTPPLNSQTLRYAGFVLLLTLKYSNYRVDTGAMSDSVVTFTYEASAVPDMQFRGTEVLPEPDASSTSRLLLERHGIRIIVRQSGTVGVFDFATLLVTANTIIGLLAVARAVVDFVSTRFLPSRHIYRQYMTVRTADFSDLDALPKSSRDRFRHEDLVNVHPSVFGRVDKHGHLHMDVPLLDEDGAPALRLEDSSGLSPSPRDDDDDVEGGAESSANGNKYPRALVSSPSVNGSSAGASSVVSAATLRRPAAAAGSSTGSSGGGGGGGRR